MDALDEDIEELIQQLLNQQVREENQIAELTEEIAYYESKTTANAERLRLANLNYQYAMDSYERDVQRRMVIEAKLKQATPIMEELKDHFIAIASMIPGCNMIKEYIVAQIATETKKIAAFEAEVDACDLETTCKMLAEEYNRRVELYESKKEENARQITQLEVEISQIKIEHSRNKKKIAEKFEPQIKMNKERIEVIKNQLQKEKARELMLREEIAQKAAREKLLMEQIAEVDAELAVSTESFAKKKVKGERELNEVFEKLLAAKETLESTQKMELELQADKMALTENVKSVNCRNEKLRDRLANMKEARRNEEAELGTLQDGNSELDVIIKNLESELHIVKSEATESKQRFESLKNENKKLKQECEAKKSAFETNFADLNQQITLLKTKAVSVQDTLKAADQEKIKLEELLKSNEALISENKMLAAQNEETELKIATHKLNLDKSNAECMKLCEKLAQTRRDGEAQISRLESDLKEKSTTLKKSNDEAVSLEENRNKLLQSVEEQKVLLAKEEVDSEKLISAVTEDYDKKGDAFDKLLAEKEAEKAAFAKKLEEQYNQMRQKLDDRNALVEEMERNLAIQFKAYAKVQENIAHKQDLLAQTMEKDKEQVFRKMQRQAQRCAENRAGDIKDGILPSSFSPILSNKRTGLRSSVDSPDSTQSSKTSKKTLSSEDAFDALLRQTPPSKDLSQNSQLKSQTSVSSVSKKLDDTKKQTKPCSQKPVSTQSSKKSNENTPPAKDKPKTPVKPVPRPAAASESRFSSLRSQRFENAQSAVKPAEESPIQDDVYNFDEGSGSPQVTSSQSEKPAEKSSKSSISAESSTNRTEKTLKTSAESAKNRVEKSPKTSAAVESKNRTDKTPKTFASAESAKNRRDKTPKTSASAESAKNRTEKFRKTSATADSSKNRREKPPKTSTATESAKNRTEKPPKMSAAAESTKRQTGKPKRTSVPAQPSKKPATKSENISSSQTSLDKGLALKEHTHALSTVRIYNSQTDSDDDSSSSSVMEPLTQEVSLRCSDIEDSNDNDDVEVLDLASLGSEELFDN